MFNRIDELKNWVETLFPSYDFKIKRVSEDASFRSYHRLFIKDKTYIVMDAPPEYEDCKSFINMTQRLSQAQVNVPVIYSKNLHQGFLLLSDFGDQLYLQNLIRDNADKLYQNAIRNIVRMQIYTDIQNLNIYNETVLRNEMTLFVDWLLTKHLNLNMNDKGYLDNIFNILIISALEQPQFFVHRDYHSRNLMIPGEGNIPGVIDYQDAIYGPLTYDLVSLLKDCYIKWPRWKINKWIDFYLEQLVQERSGLSFEKKQFQRWFDLMGVQRHLKASGIFARLSYRDNKHHFLKEIPRTLSYIIDLEQDYFELQPICRLLKETVLPGLEQQCVQ